MDWTKWLKYKAAWLLDRALTAIYPRAISCPDSVPALNPLIRGKFLFHSLDHIGDAVMATPAIEALKTNFPTYRLTVLTRPLNVGVFTHNPYIDEIVTNDVPWLSDHPVMGCLRPAYWIKSYRTIKMLRGERFDAIIDYRGDLRHILLFGYLLRPKILMGYARTGGGVLLSAHLTCDQEMHEIDKKLKLLRPFGIIGLRPKPKIWLLNAELKTAKRHITELLGSFNKPTILIDPGAKPVQQWPVERFANLAIALWDIVKKPILVSSGSQYRHTIKKLVEITGSEIVKTVGSLNVRDFVAIIANCDLVISADTGVAHIASAVGTRTVTIFGPTDPKRFWNGVEGSLIVSAQTPCCKKELHETCRKDGHPIPGLCMQSISEEMVIKTVFKTISGYQHEIN